MEFLGRCARWLVRRLVRFYYPTIEVTGRESIPFTGPVLIAANHSNSLIDPVMIGIAANRPVHFLAKAPLFKIPIVGTLLRAFGMIPAFRAQDDAQQVSRNLDSLALAAAELARGQAVGVFPEGKSHDAPHVEQVKSGAARIAVQAMVRIRESGDGPEASLRVVPLGINFERKERFRSSVWIQVGQPIDVAAVLAREGGDERRAMRQITTELDRELKRVVIHLNDPTWAPLVEDLESLLPQSGPSTRNSVAALRQRKRIADAMNHFLRSDSSRAEAVAARIRTYRANLAAQGLTPQSAIMRLRRLALVIRMTWDFLWLAFWTPAALLGLVFHLVPFAVVRAIAPRLEAGKSTVALARLTLSLPLYTAWYVTAWFAVRSYFLPWVAWTCVALMPFAGLLAVSYWRRAKALAGGWWAQTRLFWRTPELRALRAEQQNIRAELSALADEFARVAPIAQRPEPRITWQRRAWVVTRWALIVAAAYTVFVWQHAATKRGAEERFTGMNLSGLSTPVLESTLASDEAALQDILRGIAELEHRTRAMMAGFASGERSWYSQADNDAVRQLMLSYVNYRTALLRMVWRYQQHEGIADDRLRLRALLVGYASASVLFETSLKFVHWFAPSPEAMRKLNEPEPLWNIPAGLYDTVRDNLANPENRRLFTREAAEYRQALPAFRELGLFEATPLAEFHRAIARSAETTAQLNTPALTAAASRALNETRDATKAAAYRVSSFVSSWIGDTKVRQPRGGKSLITPELLEALRPKLEPGDILLERRNWFLSNAFLPGYWPHAALFVGTSNDLVRLGLDQDPRVQRRWKEFLARDAQGHEQVVIESISEGVVFTSLEHSVGEGDSVAALRPRLSLAQKREAIARAFSHTGKPYDFDFDFFSTDKLVCTELVFRAYDGDLQFPLVKVLGTTTMPALELVRKFAQERRTAQPQLDFVAFIDGDEFNYRAQFRDEAAFVETLNRPAITLLQAGRK
jgi:1-acyl-sn-glycerol-3-phosphate acyltransferase